MELSGNRVAVRYLWRLLGDLVPQGDMYWRTADTSGSAARSAAQSMRSSATLTDTSCAVGRLVAVPVSARGRSGDTRAASGAFPSRGGIP